MSDRARAALSGRWRTHGPWLVSVVITTTWTVLALRRPSSTFHFAPLLAAAAWPFTTRALRGPAVTVPAMRAAVGGLAVAAFATAELDALDALRGPTLLGGSAMAESLIAATVGALWGAWILRSPRAGIVVRALGAAGPQPRPRLGGRESQNDRGNVD